MKSVKVSVHVNQDDASTYTFNSVLEGCLAQFFYFISINRIPYFVSMKNPVIFLWPLRSSIHYAIGSCKQM